MDDFRLVGCIACWMLGYPETPYDVQHFLSGGRRIGHAGSAPLCPAHHRGVDLTWMHVVSFAKRPGTFRQVFGEDPYLTDLTDRLIVVQKLKRGILTLDALPEATCLASNNTGE
jgi:hypothetical protein